MGDGYHDAIAALLRPTEDCHVSAQIRYVKTNGERKRRILAVVVNVQGGEEACVLILKRKLGDALGIHEILPLFADFRLALSQSRPIDLADPEVATEGRTDFTLRLSSGPRELKLETSDLESLQPVLVELKRLQGIAQQRGYLADGGTHSWIEHYERTRKSLQIALAPHDETAEQVDTETGIANPFIDNSEASITGNKLKTIKDNWTATQLRARESKFADYSFRRIFVGTYNVNGQTPAESLSPWLLDANGEPYALYVLGFQELDLNTQAYLYNDTLKEDEWCSAIELALKSSGAKYVKVVSKQLVGMFIVLYVKQEERDKVQEVSAEYLGTGLLGMMGNKGAAAIRFRYYDSYFAFVDSHLAADTSMVDRRNQDYQEISRRLMFPLPSKYEDYLAYSRANPWVASYFDSRQAIASSGAATAGAPPGKAVATIFDTDHLFFLGDLNYRIGLPHAEVKALVEKGDIEQLLAFDQLLIERGAKRVFHGFKEAPITFVPTFKYDIGTSRFDTSEKKRTPSFCDRILWFQNPLHTEDEWVKPVAYRSSMSLTMSDHKPVSGIYDVKVRQIDHTKYNEVHEDITRELDKFENESLPDLSINVNVLEFGAVRFMAPVTKSVVLENQGQVIAQYRLVPKPGDKHPCKPWCFINPPVGMLVPGDTVKINITVYVDSGSAQALNAETDTLDDILVLHVENGKDFFLSISGQWLASCFGNRLDSLCRFTKPVREWTSIERRTIMETALEMDGEGDTPTSSNYAMETGVSPVPPVPEASLGFSIPLQLWRMTDFIFRFGMDVDNLFTSAGDAAIEEYIRECLDTGAEMDLSFLILDPPSHSRESSAASSPVENHSRRPSTAESEASDSGQRTPVDRRSSVQIDLEALLAKHESLRPQSLLGLASSVQFPDTVTVAKPARNAGRASSIRSMAETLIKFLDSLAEPVVPSSMSLRCIQEGYLTFAAARQTVHRLPAANYHSFKYVIKFLRAIVESYKGRGELSAERIAEIFAPILLRIPTQSDDAVVTASKSENTVTRNSNKRGVTATSRYATVTTSKAGTSQAVGATTTMVGGGTGSYMVSRTSASVATVGPTSNATRAPADSAEEVLSRKRRMFLMQMLDLSNPEID
ncbi:Endonuclease/exonuclease/phosphatase [Gaertneriomyces semiglobifer]|nr:Endonuclease/exonuclease/phosphatase [Gaertneriomyces semiglobifer]